MVMIMMVGFGFSSWFVIVNKFDPFLRPLSSNIGPKLLFLSRLVNIDFDISKWKRLGSSDVTLILILFGQMLTRLFSLNMKIKYPENFNLTTHYGISNQSFMYTFFVTNAPKQIRSIFLVIWCKFIKLLSSSFIKYSILISFIFDRFLRFLIWNKFWSELFKQE